MIYLSSNVDEFWNNKDDDTLLFLYGVSLNADAMIENIEKASVKIEGFIDKDKSRDLHDFRKYKIYSLESFNQKFADKKVKIFVTIDNVYGAVHEIQNFLNNVKVYISPTEQKGISINLAFAPVREKLLKTKNFSIIANTCIGHRMYKLTNSEYRSPFVATVIQPKDYLKICKNLEEYMNYELEFIGLEEWKFANKFHCLCRLNDVEIKFIGKTDFEEIRENWNRRVKKINYDNLFFMWDDYHYPVSKDIYDKFLGIKDGTKLIVQKRGAYIPCEHSIQYINFDFFDDVLAEKSFDLVGFLNHDTLY